MADKMEVSKHAIEQYACHFKPKISANITEGLKNSLISGMVRLAFAKSVYIKDNEAGILFRNYDLKADIIIKNKVIITIFPLKQPLKRDRRNKFNSPKKIMAGNEF
jgi:hypothetical protein